MNQEQRNARRGLREIAAKSAGIQQNFINDHVISSLDYGSNHWRRNQYRMRYSDGQKPFTDHEWHKLLEDYGGKCLRCGCTEDITIDHIIPLSKNGANTIDNLQPLCRKCNSSKGATTADYRL